ncbi:MAG: radical SAM protein, partial [Gemmatimonadaceae bacterium]
MKLTATDTQADLVYFEGDAKSMLNSPAATGMGFWSINPYVGCAFACSYCYAPYAHRYAVDRSVQELPNVGVRDRLQELPPQVAFSRRIIVKSNASAILRAELAPGRAKRVALERGETVVIGTATDPYQPAERRFRLTRGMLEVLAPIRSLDLCIITKSPLIARDADVLARIAANASVTVHLSLITIDRDLARRIEPRAPTPESRLRALRRLSDAGIEVGINIMPVLPGITDNPLGIETLVRSVADAGAKYVNTCTLRMRADTRERYLDMLQREFPELTARYRAAYARSHAVSEKYQEGLKRFVRRVCERVGIHYGSPHEDRADKAAVVEPAAWQLELALDAR